MGALTPVRFSSGPFVEQATSLAGLGLTRQFRVLECHLCFSTLLSSLKAPSKAALQQHFTSIFIRRAKDALDGSYTEFGVTWCTPRAAAPPWAGPGKAGCGTGKVCAAPCCLLLE